MKNAQAGFDSDEYLHLAGHASSVGDRHACMSYLKEVLQRQPSNAIAIYLLAIQHAEIGLFERAIRGMTAALDIEPRLEIARFQLGLLLLDGNRRAEAKEHFAALAGSLDTALRTYCEAMIALADDDSMAARQKLMLGLSQKTANHALSALMQRLFDTLAKRDAAAASGSEAQDSRVDLGAYGQASS